MCSKYNIVAGCIESVRTAIKERARPGDRSTRTTGRPWGTFRLQNDLRVACVASMAGMRIMWLAGFQTMMFVL